MKSRPASPLQRRSRLFYAAGIITAAIGVLLLLSGCGTTASVVRELSQDTNRFSLKVNGWGSSIEINRN